MLFLRRNTLPHVKQNPVRYKLATRLQDLRILEALRNRFSTDISDSILNCCASDGFTTDIMENKGSLKSNRLVISEDVSKYVKRYDNCFQSNID